MSNQPTQHAIVASIVVASNFGSRASVPLSRVEISDDGAITMTAMAGQMCQAITISADGTKCNTRAWDGLDLILDEEADIVVGNDGIKIV